MTRTRLALALTTLTLACTPEPEGTPEPRAPSTREAEPSSQSPAASTTAATTTTTPTPTLPALDEREVEGDALALAGARITTPERGPRCELDAESATTLWPTPGAADAAFVDTTLVVAAHAREDEGDALVLVALDGARARPITRIALSPSEGARTGIRPPAIASLGDARFGVASIDRAGRLLYVEASPEGGRALARRVVASDADHRFAPALARFGEKRALAYVRRGATSHVILHVLDVSLRDVTVTDITPSASSAASPFFTGREGASTLVLVDPREGFSPIYRVALDASARPSEAQVVKPVTGLLDPARIVASALGDELHIAYVAHGASQASAIGYVRAARDAPAPVSLVRPTGFGSLWVDVLTSEGLVVFAATAPLGREPSAPRAIHVRVASDVGLGDATILTLEGGLEYPSLAGRADGTLALTVTSAQGLTTLRLRCTS